MFDRWDNREHNQASFYEARGLLEFDNLCSCFSDLSPTCAWAKIKYVTIIKKKKIASEQCDDFISLESIS